MVFVVLAALVNFKKLVAMPVARASIVRKDSFTPPKRPRALLARQACTKRPTRLVAPFVPIAKRGIRLAINPRPALCAPMANINRKTTQHPSAAPSGPRVSKEQKQTHLPPSLIALAAIVWLENIKTPMGLLVRRVLFVPRVNIFTRRQWPVKIAPMGNINPTMP